MRQLRFLTVIAAVAAIACSAIGARGASFDGAFSGASSIAGGTGECWGNNPASAIVSGDNVTIRYVAYDGSQEPVTATLKPDGSFQASQPIKTGTIVYSGKVTARRLTAQWKGPVCYGTLDMTK
jgi:hypothetical protein